MQGFNEPFLMPQTRHDVSPSPLLFSFKLFTLSTRSLEIQTSLKINENGGKGISDRRPKNKKIRNFILISNLLSEIEKACPGFYMIIIMHKTCQMEAFYKLYLNLSLKQHIVCKIMVYPLIQICRDCQSKTT